MRARLRLWAGKGDLRARSVGARGVKLGHLEPEQMADQEVARLRVGSERVPEGCDQPTTRRPAFSPVSSRKPLFSTRNEVVGQGSGSPRRVQRREPHGILQCKARCGRG